MASIKKFIRQNQALQVIQHSTDGMSIVKACKEVGISRSTFYAFCNRNPDAIASFQDMQLAAAMEQFSLILENHSELLNRIIQDGLSDTTSPRQKLAIFKYLDQHLVELMDKLHAHNPNPSGNADFLSGPKLVPGQSRFSASASREGDMQYAAYTAGS